MIVAKLVYHLLQLLNDQDQLELVSVELVLLNYELLVRHDHLTSPKSPIVDRFWPSLANKSVLISKPSEQASCNRHYTTVGSPLLCILEWSQCVWVPQPAEPQQRFEAGLKVGFIDPFT